MGDPLVAANVRRYFDNAHGLPPLGDAEEYAVAFERAYPDPAVRRQWLDKWISLGHPSYGHRALVALMAIGLVRWVATTNFDDLVERAYERLRAPDANLHRMTIAALDSFDRAARVLREGDWPLLVKLHGDIASERLKNTTGELKEQDATLRQALVDASRTHGLAVIGYSGRDIRSLVIRNEHPELIAGLGLRLILTTLFHSRFCGQAAADFLSHASVRSSIISISSSISASSAT